MSRHSDPYINLSDISTCWSDIRNVYDPKPEIAKLAQDRMSKKYGTAVKRYLYGVLKNEDVTDDVFQTFMLRFLRGDFRNADPGRGQFRKYLKAALFRLVKDHYRELSNQHPALSTTGSLAAVSAISEAEFEESFHQVWRDDLLSRTWKKLATFERKTGHPFYKILCLKMNEPHLRSAQIAKMMSETGGVVRNEKWARKRLHLARAYFSQLLLNEVINSLHDPSFEILEQEVIELKLHVALKPALEQRRANMTKNRE